MLFFRHNDDTNRFIIKVHIFIYQKLHVYFNIISFNKYIFTCFVPISSTFGLQINKRKKIQNKNCKTFEENTDLRHRKHNTLKKIWNIFMEEFGKKKCVSEFLFKYKRKMFHGLITVICSIVYKMVISNE